MSHENNNDDDDAYEHHDYSGRALPPARHRKRNMTTGLMVTCLFLIGVAIVVSVTMTQLNKRGQDGSQSQNNNNNNNNGDSSSNNNNGGGGVTNDNNENDTTPIPTADLGLQRCNGLVNLCDIAVNEILYATVHNAASTKQDGVFIIPNHELNLEQALEAGYRGINIDLGKCSGDDNSSELRLVHGNCLIGSRDPIEVFENMATFLNRNPNEVVVMPIQVDNDTGGGTVTLEEMKNLWSQVPSFQSLLYSHPSPNIPWPTLLELIERNQRIILFHYNGQTCNSDDYNQYPCPSHDWFAQYGAETQFEFNTVTEFDDKTYACEITRGQSLTADWIGMNVFTKIPTTGQCDVLNEATFLTNHIQDCSEMYGYRPNLLIVDCWNRGDVLQVVKQYNQQLQAPTKQSANVVLTFGSTTATTTTTTTTDGNSLLLDTKDQIAFQEDCALYFTENLKNDLQRIQCEVLSQNVTIVTRLRRRLQTQSSTLELLVEVSGEVMDPDTVVLTSTRLQNIVEVTGNDLVSQIIASSSSSTTTTTSFLAVVETVKAKAVDDTPPETACFVCGGNPTAIMMNPDVVVDLSSFSSFISGLSSSSSSSAASDITCQDMFNAGNNGLIPPAQCINVISATTDIQITCGCTNTVTPAPTTPVPTRSPTTRSPTTITPTTQSPTTITTTTRSPTTDTPTTRSPTTVAPSTRILSTTIAATTGTPTTQAPVTSATILPLDFSCTTSTVPLTDDGTLSLSMRLDFESITCELTYEGQGWLGLAFVEEASMIPAMAVIGLPDEESVLKYLLLSKSTAGVNEAPTEEQTLTNTIISQNETHTVLAYTRPFVDPSQVNVIPNGLNRINYAIGFDNTLGQHLDRGSVQFDLSVLCNEDDLATQPTVSPIVAETEVPTVLDSLVCNGFKNLCDVPVNEVMFATVHNAASTSQDGVTAFPNHQFNLESALDAGWRGINLDFGVCDGALQLVHGFCFIGYRDPVEVFTNIRNFLNANTNEVIILPTQVDNTLEAEVTNDMVERIFESIEGFQELLYSHPGPDSPWPTLREMIESNQRIIFMHYNGEPCYEDEEETKDCPEGFHDWFMYTGETQFQFASINRFDDISYSCEITRGPNQQPDFFGINLFTQFPSDASCATLNSRDFLESHINSCSQLNGGLQPNFLIVDCWNVGDVQAVVDEFNAALTP